MDYQTMTTEALLAILEKSSWGNAKILSRVLGELALRNELPEEYNRMVDNQYTIAQMLIDSGLNWEVEKWPILYQNPADEAELLGSPSYGLVRLDNRDVLKRRCEGGYYITQNRDTLTYIAEVAFQTGLKMEKAACLDGGRKVMVMLHMGQVEIGNDVLDRYIYAIDSHDGSTGLAIGFSDTVMSCTNQFYRFYGKAAKLRHTSGLGDRIAAMVQFIRDNQGQVELHNTNYLKMAATKVKISDIYDLIELITEVHLLTDDLEAVHAKRLQRAESLRDCIESEMSSKGNTFWGLFNGVTYFYNHEYRQDDEKVLDLAFGKSYETQNQVYDWILSRIK